MSPSLPQRRLKRAQAARWANFHKANGSVQRSILAVIIAVHRPVMGLKLDVLEEASFIGSGREARLSLFELTKLDDVLTGQSDSGVAMRSRERCHRLP